MSDKDKPAHERARAADRRRQQRHELVHSGKDFGALRNLDETRPKDCHMRIKGQLYRIGYPAKNSFALFRVAAIGEEGVPTEPHIFTAQPDMRRVHPLSGRHTLRRESLVKDAILAGRVK
jgi:hypothetical protein